MFDEYICLFMMLIDHTVGNIIHMKFAINYISYFNFVVIPRNFIIITWCNYKVKIYIACGLCSTKRLAAVSNTVISYGIVQIAHFGCTVKIL